MRALKKFLLLFLCLATALAPQCAFAAKESPIQTAFNAGEFSPLMEGHINLEKRADAGLLVQNLIALKQGPLVRRGGTKFVKEIKTSANRTALVPFEFSTTQAYMIEAGNDYFRFYRNNGVITLTGQNITGITKADPAVVTYSGSDTYANGDEVYISAVAGMTEVNGKFFLVANVDTGANTFELTDVDGNNIDSTNYTTYSSAGTAAEVYTVTSPYDQADLFDSSNIFQIQYAQSADVLFLLHGDYEPRALTRTAHTSWTLSTLDLIDGPYLDVNATTTTLTPSGGSYAKGDSPTVTASAVTGINGGDGFQTTDIGRVMRIKNGSNWAWGEITARASTTAVTVLVKSDQAFPSSATANWRLGVYSDTTGWPRNITFFQDRMVFAGNDNYPDRFDMSKTGGYSNTEIQFSPTETDGTVADDNAISGTLQSGRVNAIQWMSADEKGLIIGTTAQEWIVRPDETNAAITPSNAKADPVSSTGGAYIKPIQAESGTVFVQRARRKLFDIIYSFELDRLKPRDLTLAAEHITANQVTSVAYQQEPINVVWAVRNDGTLIGQTYYPDQGVFGWHRHIIGGYSAAEQAAQAKVESIAVIPSPDGARDELWMIVQRHINGSTRRYIEYMTRYYEDDIDQEDAFHVDSGLTYDGAATATVTGLDHLEGETVKAMVDGLSHPDLTVSGGAVTLANNVTGSTIQIGLSNVWAFKSLQLEAGAKDGTAQGKTKRISGLAIRLLNTLGLRYGPDADTLDEYDFNQGTAFDEMTPLYTGDTPFLRWPGGHETKGEIYLTQDGVFPAAILATMPQVLTQDR